MGWSAFVFGELSFPVDGLERWKGSPADPRGFPDWDEAFYVDADEEPPLVKALFASLSALEGTDASPDFFDAVEEPSRVRIRAYLGEDTYNEFATHLAAAARVAAASGGSGELFLSDFQAIDFAWRVQVKNGTSRVEAVDAQAILRRPEVEKIMARAGEVAGRGKTKAKRQTARKKRR